MNRTQYIFLTALLLLTGCAEHPLTDFEVGNEGEKPIEFGLSSDFSVGSKAAIDDGTNYTDYTDYGFIVQAGLTVASEKTESWKTNTVFGSNGTEVTYGTDGWGYSPARYWQYGSYSFAGAMPSSAGFTASLDAATHKQLTLHFGDGGYDLRAGQDDIMVGFKTVDVQSASSAPTVNFNFEHQMSLVVINGAYKETAGKIRVDKIEVYGNTAKTVGNMVFTHDETKINASYSLDSQSVTDEDNVYQTIEGAWELLPSTPITTIVPGLLVFPEECDFSIVVTYTDLYGNKDGVQKTKSAALHSNWERGKKYTYTFNVNLDHISFAEPTVTDWVSGGNVDTGIEM